MFPHGLKSIRTSCRWLAVNHGSGKKHPRALTGWWHDVSSVLVRLGGDVIVGDRQCAIMRLDFVDSDRAQLRSGRCDSNVGGRSVEVRNGPDKGHPLSNLSNLSSESSGTGARRRLGRVVQRSRVCCRKAQASVSSLQQSSMATRARRQCALHTTRLR